MTRPDTGAPSDGSALPGAVSADYSLPLSLPHSARVADVIAVERGAFVRQAQDSYLAASRFAALDRRGTDPAGALRFLEAAVRLGEGLRAAGEALAERLVAEQARAEGRAVAVPVAREG